MATTAARYIVLNPKKSVVATSISEFGKPLRIHKPRSFWDLAFTFQNFAEGQKVTRYIWKNPGCYWLITKVIPTVHVSYRYELFGY